MLKSLLLVMIFASVSWSQSVTIEKVARPPKLEDFLGGGNVPGFARISGFRQNKPDDGKPVSRETVAWVAYDDENFYAAFFCKADPASLRAHMAKRDDIETDDFVGLFLDTFHDKLHNFSFFVNPLGIQADEFGTEGQEDDYTFDAVWKSEGRITSDGYAVLMAIPFRSLRFPKADIQTWGIGLGRFIPELSEDSFWPYNTSAKEGFATQLGTLEGLRGISPGRNVQFIPYGVFGASHFLSDPDTGPPQFRQRYDHRAGLDAKMILHDAFTLDVTVNPDFSQVESDSPQVTIDQRFEVFFPEKRPFFLENANYFHTPEMLFFSRRIADPEFGVRLTGSANGWTAGLLAMDDRAPGQQPGAAEFEPGKRALIGAGRLQREFGNESTVGVLFTNYAFAGSAERVISLDTRLRLGSNWVFTGQAARSQTNYAGGTRPRGSLVHGELEYEDLHLQVSSAFRSLGPGFVSTLSYIPRVDIRQGEHSVGWKWRPSSRIVKSFGPVLEMEEDWDHTGALQDWSISPGFSAELIGNTRLHVARAEALEVFHHLNFRKHSTDFSLHSELSRLVELDFNFGSGSDVNYQPATGVQPFLGFGHELSAHIAVRPSKKLKLTESYIFSNLSTLERSRIAAEFGSGAVFNNHLIRSQLNYQFTRELSLRTIIDYNGVLPNTSLIDLTPAKKVTADFLLTWLATPGTAIYLGYTNTHENLAILPGASPALAQSLPPTPDYVGTIPGPSTTTGRQLFVKVSYLFRR